MILLFLDETKKHLTLNNSCKNLYRQSNFLLLSILPFILTDLVLLSFLPVVFLLLGLVVDHWLRVFFQKPGEEVGGSPEPSKFLLELTHSDGSWLAHLDPVIEPLQLPAGEDLLEADVSHLLGDQQLEARDLLQGGIEELEHVETDLLDEIFQTWQIFTVEPLHQLLPAVESVVDVLPLLLLHDWTLELVLGVVPLLTQEESKVNAWNVRRGENNSIEV